MFRRDNKGILQSMPPYDIMLVGNRYCAYRAL